jgi:hypothetical protein
MYCVGSTDGEMNKVSSAEKLIRMVFWLGRGLESWGRKSWTLVYLCRGSAGKSQGGAENKFCDMQRGSELFRAERSIDNFLKHFCDGKRHRVTPDYAVTGWHSESSTGNILKTRLNVLEPGCTRTMATWDLFMNVFYRSLLLRCHICALCICREKKHVTLIHIHPIVFKETHSPFSTQNKTGYFISNICKQTKIWDIWLAKLSSRHHIVEPIKLGKDHSALTAFTSQSRPMLRSRVA